MNGLAVDADPLSSYEYPAYDSYGLQAPYNYANQALKPPTQMPYIHNNYNTVLHINTEQVQTNAINDSDVKLEKHNDSDVKLEKQIENLALNRSEAVVNPEEDVKPNITDEKIKKKLKGKRSSYWSVKIPDKDFAFYGCSVCNISFATLQLLDQHVTVHKDRITSYDLRVQNQIKRKRLKKEKKSKKLKKIKAEPVEEIEIKPEDGYIGTERASEFSESGLVSKINNNESKVDDNGKEKKCGTKDKEGSKKDTEEEGKKNKDLQKIYKCFACQKQFSLSYYLRLHVRSHTDEKPYTCAVCGQSFITASKLGRHNKRIHLAIRYQCRICYKFFSQFDLLTRHFDKKHPEDKLEGEPYDYNAILPYLKELEEQLKEKSEEEKSKQKKDEVWPDQWVGSKESIEESVKENRENVEVEVPPIIEPPPVVLVEEAKLCTDDEIKQEVEDDVVRNDDDFNDDRYSDEDFFPSNTWAKVSPPRTEPDTSLPRRTRSSKVGGTITCEICKKTISSATYLKIHMRTHTGEKPYKCYICNRGFITESKVHRHVLTHAGKWGDTLVKKEEVTDEDDDRCDGDDEELKGNKKVKKSKSKYRKKRQKKEQRSEKQNKKRQKRPHACGFCQKRFLHLETLQVHRKSHDGEVLVPKCFYCLQEMPDESALKDHEATHSGPKPFLCVLCGKSYKKRETLVYHRKNHKAERRDYICDVCSKRFVSPGKLQRHLAAHAADKFVLRYECPVCAHMFNTKYHVKMHLATHMKEGLIREENRNEIVAMVLQNARKFPKNPGTSTNLTDIMPTDERSRICNICGEIFQHFYYLEEHLKSHGSRIAMEDLDKPEEKKYTCDVCKKSFKLHYYLKLHKFTHTKEKPFTCQQCGKGFITKGKLKRHLETHTGLKKYQCHVCYKFFTRPSYLRIHVRTIHGTQDYNFRLGKNYGLGALGTLSVMTQLGQGGA